MSDKLEIKEIKYLVVEDPEDGQFSIWITVAPFSGEKDCAEFIKKKFKLWQVLIDNRGYSKK